MHWFFLTGFCEFYVTKALLKKSFYGANLIDENSIAVSNMFSSKLGEFAVTRSIFYEFIWWIILGNRWELKYIC